MNIHMESSGVQFWLVYLRYGLFQVFFVPQDLIDNNLLFWENSFSEERASCWFLKFNLTSCFGWKWAAFTGTVMVILVTRNYGRKLLVRVKFHNLYSFKQGVIFLCQSVLETTQISDLYSSNLFTVPLQIAFHRF